MSLDHTEHEDQRGRPRRSFWTSKAGLVAAGVLLVGLFFLLSDPRAPLFGVLPYYLANLNLGEHNDLWTFGLWEYRDAAYYWRTLVLARAGNLVFALILFAYAYRWSSLLYGPRAGLVAAALVATTRDETLPEPIQRELRRELRRLHAANRG